MEACTRVKPASFLDVISRKVAFALAERLPFGMNAIAASCVRSTETVTATDATG